MSSTKAVSVYSNVHNTSQIDYDDDAVDEDEAAGLSHLPPRICANERKKIEPEQGYLTIRQNTRGRRATKMYAGLIWVPEYEIKTPTPTYEHALIWWPKNLCFRLKQDEQSVNLNIMNQSQRIIYIQYKGLWDKTIQSGASWFVQPKTRSFVAPGMFTQLQVKALPHKQSIVQQATAGLQLATNFQRDLVLGYFFVPIVAVFENYVSPEDLDAPLASSTSSPVEWAAEYSSIRSSSDLS